ncbi:MAG: hypothetical protein ACKOA6_14075 [Actinomycetota bacterium]
MSTEKERGEHGCHVAVHHPEAAGIVRELATTHRVIADVRPPDIVRLGLSPLTTRFTDVWDGIEQLHSVASRS